MNFYKLNGKSCLENMRKAISSVFPVLYFSYVYIESPDEETLFFRDKKRKNNCGLILIGPWNNELKKINDKKEFLKANYDCNIIYPIFLKDRKNFFVNYEQKYNCYGLKWFYPNLDKIFVLSELEKLALSDFDSVNSKNRYLNNHSFLRYYDPTDFVYYKRYQAKPVPKLEGSENYDSLYILELK